MLIYSSSRMTVIQTSNEARQTTRKQKLINADWLSQTPQRINGNRGTPLDQHNHIKYLCHLITLMISAGDIAQTLNRIGSSAWGSTNRVRPIQTNSAHRHYQGVR